MPFLFLVAISEFYLVFSWLGALWTEAPALFWIGFAFLQFLIASQLWLYFFFFQSGAEETVRFESPLRNLAFHSMGFLSFLFSFTLLRDFLALLFLFFGKASLFYGLTPTRTIFALSMGAYALGFFNAHFRVETPRITVPIADLPPNLKGLKIVQLSDMHLGTGPNHHQIKKLVDQALALKPDIIVLTGDIFDGMIADIGLELRHLARLKAPHGVYFVLGNHECYWNWQEGVAKIKELGFIPLLNEGQSITIRDEKLFIAGITDPAAAHAGGVAPIVPVPPKDSRFNLMLVHQPQLAKQVSKENYHLQLSGHTHGGQFFPWNLAVKRMYPISGGLGKEGTLWVYVSHGSGYWGPPIRLGTLGEVTELCLE
jgi:predicted MPP superfamily phosphohydrolase